MSVPAHDERDFEFATKVRDADSAGDSARGGTRRWQRVLPFVSEDGVLVNSGEFDGLSCTQAQRKLQEVARERQFGEAKVTSA
jgi:leucyl-tRNA synthetase